MTRKVLIFALGVSAMSLLTGCLPLSVITDNQILAETSDVLRLHPSAVVIQNREEKGSTLLYNAKTQSGDQYNCLINGKDYSLGLKLAHPPTCTKIEVAQAVQPPTEAQPQEEVSQPKPQSKKTSKSKSKSSKPAAQAQRYLNIGVDTTGSTIYGDTKYSRQMSSDTYNAIIKYKFFEKKTAYNKKVDYAIVDSIVSCGGIKKMTATNYQLFDSSGVVIKEPYRNDSLLIDLQRNSEDVVLHSFCSE